MRYTRITFTIFTLSLLSGLFPGSVFAHASGASLYATTSPYVIDLGYDPAAAFAGESMRFDFVLASETTGGSAPYEQVWVRIKDERQTLLATGIVRQPFGPTTLLYVFAKPGIYTIQPSYRDKDGNELAGASFPFTVIPDPTATTFTALYGTLVASALAGLLLGAVLTKLFIIRKERNV